MASRRQRTIHAVAVSYEAQLSLQPAGTIRLAPYLSLHKQARSAKRTFPASKGVRLLGRHAHQSSSRTFSHQAHLNARTIVTCASGPRLSRLEISPGYAPPE